MHFPWEKKLVKNICNSVKSIGFSLSFLHTFVSNTANFASIFCLLPCAIPTVSAAKLGVSN